MAPHRRICVTSALRQSLALAMSALLALAAAGASAQSQPEPETTVGVPGGPMRLRQPTQPAANPAPEVTRQEAPAIREADPNQTVVRRPPSSDFELFVNRTLGLDEAGGQPMVRRVGTDLLASLPSASSGGNHSPLVPPEYLIRSGDELLVSLWGTVDADLRLVVDRSGRISIPRVGPVMVSGVRYADLPDVIGRRVGQVFKGFQVSVALGRLSGMRVYVTGFVQNPGVLVVNSLATVAQALISAGGPSAAGSFRDIQVRSGRDAIARFDLYDFLLKGDRSADRLLQPDDVVHVGPIGTQVALVGSVNRPAIFELKSGETLADVLRMAGGFNAVADTSRLTLQRLGKNGQQLTQLELPAAQRHELLNGDLLRALNAVELIRPTGGHNKRVHVEGEVTRPGIYVFGPASTLNDVIRAAGGLSKDAYLYGTEFTRESVRATQQQNYERALRDFETQLTVAASSRRSSSTEDAAGINSAAAANARLIEQLRTRKPTGRIVLQLTPASDALPDMVVEDGDRIYIPSRSATVGVFGSVFSAGSYLHAASRNVGDYLRLAGGPTRGADAESVFVIRANGTVRSSLQESGFLTRGNQISNLGVEPGDTIFVPEEVNKATWVQNAKDWTQILYQFGIGIAGIRGALN